MQASRRNRIFARLGDLLFVALLLTAVSLIAWLSLRFDSRIDLSYGGRNTLSLQTQALLSRFDDPLEITGYSGPALRGELEPLLLRYQMINRGIVLEWVDPTLDPQRARDDRVTQEGELLLRYRGRSERVREVSESSVSNAIQRLLRREGRQLLFLTGHGERDPFGTGPGGYQQLRAQLELQGFTLTTHNLIAEPTLPEEAALVILAAPERALLEAEVERLIDYLERGGALLWLEDPEPVAELDRLIEHLGLNWILGTLVDNSEARAQLGIDHPAAIPVIDYPDPELGGWDYFTLFPVAAALEPIGQSSEPGDWMIDPLLLSPERSWAEVNSFDSSPDAEAEAETTEEMVLEPEAGDRAGPLTLGVLLRPRPSELPGDARQGRVAVIGDSDFASNAFLGLGGNLDLALNLFNWVAGEIELLDIQPAAVPDRQLNLSERTGYLIALAFLILLPLLFLLIGVAMWWARHRR